MITTNRNGKSKHWEVLIWITLWRAAFWTMPKISRVISIQCQGIKTSAWVRISGCIDQKDTNQWVYHFWFVIRTATNFSVFRDVFNTFWNGQCWNLSLSLQSVAGVQSLKSWALSCPYTSSRTSGSGTKMCKVDNGRWPLTPIAAIIPIGTILICNIDLMGMTHLYAFRRKKYMTH